MDTYSGKIFLCITAFVAIVCLSIAMIIICAFCIAEKPKSNPKN